MAHNTAKTAIGGSSKGIKRPIGRPWVLFRHAITPAVKAKHIRRHRETAARPDTAHAEIGGAKLVACTTGRMNA